MSVLRRTWKHRCELLGRDNLRNRLPRMRGEQKCDPFQGREAYEGDVEGIVRDICVVNDELERCYEELQSM